MCSDYRKFLLIGEKKNLTYNSISMMANVLNVAFAARCVAEFPLRFSRENFKQVFINHCLPLCRPGWPADRIEFKVCEDGTTNLLVDVSRDSQSSPELLLRVNGENTEMFIDREYEVAVMRCLHTAGMGPKIHCSFENGLCYGYIPGRTLHLEELYDPIIGRKVAATLAFMHSVPPPPVCGQVTRSPRLYQFLEDWMKLISSRVIPTKRLMH